MQAGWQNQSGSLSCQWSGVFEPASPRPTWFEDAQESAAAQDSAVIPVPNFATHSLLGSGEWFVPWKLRWVVPR
jgi:hypothetical protein